MLEFLIGVIVALSAYIWREYRRTKNIIRAIIVESETSLEKTRYHLETSDYDAVKARIEKDSDYIPFVSVYPSPEHLYTKAIEDSFLLTRDELQAIVKAYKAEMASDEFIRSLQSDAFKKMDQDRRKSYVDMLVKSYREQQEAFGALLSTLDGGPKWKQLPSRLIEF